MRRALSVVELLISLVLVGLLAAVGNALYNNARTKAMLAVQDKDQNAFADVLGAWRSTGGNLSQIVDSTMTPDEKAGALTLVFQNSVNSATRMQRGAVSALLPQRMVVVAYDDAAAPDGSVRWISDHNGGMVRITSGAGFKVVDKNSSDSRLSAAIAASQNPDTTASAVASLLLNPTNAGAKFASGNAYLWREDNSAEVAPVAVVAANPYTPPVSTSTATFNPDSLRRPIGMVLHEWWDESQWGVGTWLTTPPFAYGGFMQTTVDSLLTLNAEGASPSVTHNYPNHPTDSNYRTSLTTEGVWIRRAERFRAYLVPQTTGNYVFTLNAAGDSRLLLSTDKDPNNAVVLVNKASGSTDSAPVSLVAGQRYYIELLTISGGGNPTYVSVRLEGGGFSNSTLAGCYLEIYPVAPTLQIVQQPVGATLPTGAAYSFLVSAAGPNELAYQWYKNGQAISIANFPVCTVSNSLQTSDSGSYYVVVTDTVTGQSIQSNTAGLTVVDNLVRGCISYERWGGSGSSLVINRGLNQLQSLSRYPGSPDFVEYRTTLTCSNGLIGERLRGFVLPPKEGDYIFTINGFYTDFQSQLLLGASADPNTRRVIAESKSSTGISAPVHLMADVPYYIELLNANAINGSYPVTVSFKTTDGSFSSGPIAGNYLSPFPLQPYGSPLVIRTQPVGATLSVGADYSLFVAADSSNGQVTYQWYKDGAVIAGATQPLLPLENLQTTDSGNYTVVVTDSLGSVTSNAAGITVTSNLPRGYISVQRWTNIRKGIADLLAQPTYPNSPNATFYLSSITGGTGWVGERFRGFVLPPKTADYIFDLNAFYTEFQGRLILGTSADPNSGRVIAEADSKNASSAAIHLVAETPYYIEFLNANAINGSYSTNIAFRTTDGSFSSGPIVGAYLSPYPLNPLGSLPVIVQQPLGATLPAGASTGLTVVANSTNGRVTYQWYKDGAVLAGATEPELVFDPLQLSDTGNYTVVVSDSVGSVTSSVAGLKVTSAMATGYISYENWLVGNNNFPNSPSNYGVFNSLCYSTWPGQGTYTRMRGFLIMPATGDYLLRINGFYSGNTTYVYLSTNADPNNKRLIVAASSQNVDATSPVHLLGGVPYYIEVLNSSTCCYGFNVEVRPYGSASTGTPIPGWQLAPFPVAQTLTITQQPVGANLQTGGGGSLSVYADSINGIITYQWYKNGVAISGATAQSYAIANAQASDAGAYTVVVNDGVSSITSNAATVTVAAGDNTGFELPNQGSGSSAYHYYTGTTTNGWTYVNNSGVAANGSAFGVSGAQNGNTNGTTSASGQAAFIQNSGGVAGSVSEVINCPTGNITISFKMEARGGYGSNPVQVRLDNTVLGTYTPGSSSSFSLPSGVPITTAVSVGSHTLSFTGTSTSGDCTTFLDSVTVTNN